MARQVADTDHRMDFVIADEADAVGARAAAFKKAERHSRRVRRLKVMLPTLGLMMIVGFIGYSLVATPGSAAIDPGTPSLAEGKLVMDSPKLEGFTGDGRPYSVSATRATQDFDRQDIIGLAGIDANMPIETENWARVEAAAGTYDRMANTLDVPTEIVVTTTDGIVAKLQSAFVDIANGTLKSAAPVDIQSDGSRISAGSMSVLDSGKTVVFGARVRVHIDLAKMKAADAARGEANASN